MSGILIFSSLPVGQISERASLAATVQEPFSIPDRSECLAGPNRVLSRRVFLGQAVSVGRTSEEATMSTLVVEVCEVKAVYPHPNADALEFITVKGWPVIVQKALGLTVGQRVVYFPPDTVMPPELADRLGIARYLSPLPREIDGTRKPGLRVRAARLRGEPSYGTIDHAVDPAWEVGRDVRDHYGVTKFEPPVRPTDGDALPAVAAFHRYTDIENIRNFPDVLMPGEEVVITEKLHGKNCRLGLVRVPGEGGDTFEFMAGSNDVRRKEVDQKGRPSDFWRPMTEAVRDLLRHLERWRAERRPLRGTLRQRRAGHGLRDGQRGQGVPGLRPRRGRHVPRPRREGGAVRPVRGRDGAPPVPGAVLVGGGRGAHLRPDDHVPARCGGEVRGPGGVRRHAGRGAIRPRTGRRRSGHPQVDLGRLPGPQGGHRRALKAAAARRPACGPASTRSPRLTPSRLVRRHLGQVAAGVEGEELEPLVHVESAGVVDRHPHPMERPLAAAESPEEVEALPDLAPHQRPHLARRLLPRRDHVVGPLPGE